MSKQSMLGITISTTNLSYAQCTSPSAINETDDDKGHGIVPCRSTDNMTSLVRFPGGFKAVAAAENRANYQKLVTKWPPLAW